MEGPPAAARTRARLAAARSNRGGRRTARPSARVDPKRSKTLRFQRYDGVGKNRVAVLRGRNGRGSHVKSAGDAEQAVLMARRKLRGRLRRPCCVAVVAAQFGSPRRIVGAAGHRPAGCRCKNETLQNERIGEHQGKNASQRPMHNRSHDATPIPLVQPKHELSFEATSHTGMAATIAVRCD